MTFTVDAPIGAMLGIGYNEASADLRSVAVKGDVGTEGDGNLSTDFQVSMVSDSTHLTKSMAISAGVNVNTMNFGLDAQVDFRDRVAVSANSTNVFMRILVLRRPERLINARLTDEAHDLLAFLPPKTKRFHERFGGHFVRQIVHGGVFYGVARIESLDKEKEQELGVDVSMRIGNIFGGSVDNSNDFSKKFSNSTDRIEVHVLASGGSPRPVLNIAELLAEMQQFEADLGNGMAVPVTAQMSPYSQLALPSDDVSFVQEQVARAFLDELGANFNAQLELRNRIDSVLRNADAYKPFNKGKFQQALATIASNLNKIAAAADSCARDRTQCALPPNVPVPALTFPERKGKTPKPKPHVAIPMIKPQFAARQVAPQVNLAQLAIAHQFIVND